MAKARKRKAKQKLPKSIILILDSGRDFFHELNGGIEQNLDLLEAAWRDVEIRKQVVARCEAKRIKSRPWAEEKFGK